MQTDSTFLVRFESQVQQLDYLNYWIISLSPDILSQLPGRSEKGDFNQRLLINLDGKITWQCGVLALGDGWGMITIQQSRLKKIGKTLNDQVTVSLKKDDSEFGVEVPEEIQEYWSQVPESKARFDFLSPAWKRYILNFISSAKTENKRLERTHTLMRNLLLTPVGQENFRQLQGKE
jgi:hypothetical protein